MMYDRMEIRKNKNFAEWEVVRLVDRDNEHGIIEIEPPKVMFTIAFLGSVTFNDDLTTVQSGYYALSFPGENKMECSYKTFVEAMYHGMTRYWAMYYDPPKNQDDGGEEDKADIHHCEKCGIETMCESIPLLHGYLLWLCRKCAAAAYHSGEAV